MRQEFYKRFDDVQVSETIHCSGCPNWDYMPNVELDEDGKFWCEECQQKLDAMDDAFDEAAGESAVEIIRRAV